MYNTYSGFPRGNVMTFLDIKRLVDILIFRNNKVEGKICVQPHISLCMQVFACGTTVLCGFFGGYTERTYKHTSIPHA